MLVLKIAGAGFIALCVLILVLMIAAGHRPPPTPDELREDCRVFRAALGNKPLLSITPNELKELQYCTSKGL
jgi:hypothetical protein